MAEFATDSKAVSDIGDRAAMGKKLVGTAAAEPVATKPIVTDCPEASSPLSQRAGPMR